MHAHNKVRGHSQMISHRSSLTWESFFHIPYLFPCQDLSVGDEDQTQVMILLPVLTALVSESLS